MREGGFSDYAEDGGMSVAEIAAVHDVNKSTVRRSVNRAKKTLQDYLQFGL